MQCQHLLLLPWPLQQLLRQLLLELLVALLSTGCCCCFQMDAHSCYTLLLLLLVLHRQLHLLPLMTALLQP
jgi:hypothetical protein